MHWQNNDAKKSIVDAGGSKAGLVDFVREHAKQLLKNLPHGSQYLEYGADVEKFLNEFDFDLDPVIIRACHPQDYVGMVDVIDTKIAYNKSDARKYIQKLYDDANSDLVKSYMKWETGEDFDGKIGILAQYFQGYAKGSIVEEPHDPGVFRVVTLYDENRGAQPAHVNQFFDSAGRKIHVRHDDFKGKNEQELDDEFYVENVDLEFPDTYLYQMEYEDHLPAVIAMYRSLKDAGFNPESHSFQMEFGINQLDKKRPCLYQARIFRPFAPRADFDLRRADYGTGLGVTNKDGEKFSLHSLLYGENNNLKHPKAFYNHSAGQSLCLDFQPEHASAYAAPNALDILDHGDYRWIQKIPLFVNGRFEHGAPEVRELEQDGKEFDVRIKSNGQAASIEFLND